MHSPLNVKEVWSLMGYYSRFISRFSEIVAPIVNRTKKSRIFKRRTECQSSLDLLKDILARLLLLSHTDLNKPYTIYTDVAISAYFVTLMASSGRIILSFCKCCFKHRLSGLFLLSKEKHMQSTVPHKSWNISCWIWGLLSRRIADSWYMLSSTNRRSRIPRYKGDCWILAVSMLSSGMWRTVVIFQLICSPEMRIRIKKLQLTPLSWTIITPKR